MFNTFSITRIEEPEWNVGKDNEKKEQELQKLGKPPMPLFNQKNRCSSIIPIEDLLEKKDRPEK
jgi:hypothetical protein